MATVLLDIGNVLWCDDAGDAFTLDNVGAVLREYGVTVTPALLHQTKRRAVFERAPSAWRTTIAALVPRDRDIAEAVEQEVRRRWQVISIDRYRAWTTPFPSSRALVSGLAADGHQLLLASNNERRALDRLEELGLLEYFFRPAVSDTLGLAKPDPRFFEHILASAGAGPARSLMVGDRLGNDIAPANALGMKTLRLRIGSHADQLPRGAKETPDETVADPVALLPAARRLLADMS